MPEPGARPNFGIWEDFFTPGLVQDSTVMYMTTTMTVSEARAALPEILERVKAGGEVTLTRHGEPVAVVVRPDTLRSRRADAALAGAARIHEQLEQARARPLHAEGTLDGRYAEAMIDDVRASRSHR